MNTALTGRVDERVVDALIGARLVDPSDRAQSLVVVGGVLDSATLADQDEPRTRSLPQLVEVVAYLGGALVLAAGALFLFQQWGELDFGPRVAVLAVATVVLLVAGAVAAQVPEEGPALRDRANDVRRRLAGSLLTFGALGAAFLVGHVVDHAMTVEFPEVYWPAVAGAVIGVVVGAIGYRVAPTAVGLVGTIGGAVTATMTLIDGVDRYEGDAAGVALFLLGALWLGFTEMRWFHQPTIARSLGATVALVGAQVPVMDGTHSWLGYGLTLVVAVAGIALYLGKMAWPYLAAAVIAVTLVVPEAISEWTDGSLGEVGGVLVAGITLLLASFAGYRIRAEATD
jgi:MFS family permease